MQLDPERCPGFLNIEQRQVAFQYEITYQHIGWGVRITSTISGTARTLNPTIPQTHPQSMESQNSYNPQVSKKLPYHFQQARIFVADKTIIKGAVDPIQHVRAQNGAQLAPGRASLPGEDFKQHLTFEFRQRNPDGEIASDNSTEHRNPHGDVRQTGKSQPDDSGMRQNHKRPEQAQDHMQVEPVTFGRAPLQQGEPPPRGVKQDREQAGRSTKNAETEADLLIGVKGAIELGQGPAQKLQPLHTYDPIPIL